MTYFIILIISCCSALLVPAQSTSQFPFIGHPVSEFKDSLICKDAFHLDKTYAEYPACKSFLVTPASAIYRYGAMEFSSVFLFPDEVGIVMSFSHDKVYLKEETGSSVKEDEAVLTTYFSKSYGSPAIKRVKTAYADDRTITWKKDGMRVTLLINTIKKRKNVRLRYILQLDIAKE